LAVLLEGLAVLAGCASPPAPLPVAVPVAAAAPALSGNELRVLVFRGGRAVRLGHNHVLRSGDLQVRMGETGPELRFRLDALVVDPPELRASRGEAFASRVDEASAAGTRVNMLKSLDAAEHPEVVVRTLRQVGEGGRRAAEIAISLHGVTRRQWITVEVNGPAAHGTAVVRQSDFGIQPFSVLGGLLAVQDELVVEFDLSP
jgi:hypothetical protein